MWARAIQLCPPLSSFSLVVRDSRQVTDALLPIRFGGPVDAVGISSRLKIERLHEFRRIKDVVELVLVKHLVRFSYIGVEPSRDPDHGSGENAILRLRLVLLRREFDQLCSGGRIGRRRNVPGLIPRRFGIRQ